MRAGAVLRVAAGLMAKRSPTRHLRLRSDTEKIKESAN